MSRKLLWEGFFRSRGIQIMNLTRDIIARIQQGTLRRYPALEQALENMPLAAQQDMIRMLGDIQQNLELRVKTSYRRRYGW